MKVFLGGTWNESTWRSQIIPLLDAAGIGYFNPVVPDWTPECQAEELRQRQECDFCLYVITKEMTGVYSVAEAVESSCKHPQRTIFSYVKEGFTEAQIRSLNATARMIGENGATVCFFDDIAGVLSGFDKSLKAA